MVPATILGHAFVIGKSSMMRFESIGPEKGSAKSKGDTLSEGHFYCKEWGTYIL
jgi:hypothetical protein